MMLYDTLHHLENNFIAPFLLNKDLIHKVTLQMAYELSLEALCSLQSAVRISISYKLRSKYSQT